MSIFIQRIGHYIYGEDTHFSVNFYAPYMYVSDNHLTMYDNHRKLDKVLKRYKGDLTNFQKNVMKKLNYYKSVEVNDITYKVNRRPARQLQRNQDGHPLSGNVNLIARNLKIS